MAHESPENTEMREKPRTEFGASIFLQSPSDPPESRASHLLMPAEWCNDNAEVKPLRRIEKR